MKIWLRSLTLFTAFLLLNKTYATHIMGADITYNCLGGNQYEVVVTLFRYCGPAPGGGTPAGAPTTVLVDINSSCLAQTLTLPQVPSMSGIDVSQVCPNQQSACSGGPWPGVQMYTYSTVVSVQPNCGLVTFSYGECCMNQLNNMVDPSPPSLGFYVESTLNSNASGCDNAPVFTSLPIPYLCVGQPFSYSHGAYDSDGDSLYYSLITPMDDIGTPLTFQAPYTATNPLPTSSGFNFNNLTGQIQFTPTQQGYWVVAVRCDAYRDGVLIGSTMRVMQLIVINCTNIAPDAPNTLTAANVISGTLVNPTALGVCPGDTLIFDIPATDANGDSIIVTSNILTALPGATISTQYTPGGSSSVTRIAWPVSAQDSGIRYITIQFKDNNCPIVGIEIVTYQISVFEGTTVGLDAAYCTSGAPVTVTATGGNQFSWNPTTYMISASPDSSVVTFAPVQTTTYTVTSNLIGGCKNSDTITIFNVPPITAQTSAVDDTICLNSSTQLNTVPFPANLGPYTYAWSGPANSIESGGNTATPTVRPISTTWFHVTVTSAAGCQFEDSVEVVVQGVGPIVTVTSSANFVCPGTPVTLTAQASSLGCGTAPDPLNPCLPNSNFVIQTLGNGSSGSATDVTPYYGFYMDRKIQILYRAAELQALGLGAGSITDIAFFIVSKQSSQPYNDFTISMGCTNLNALPANAYVTGLTQVTNPTPYNSIVGWNTHTLDFPYTWDGTSNLIVQVCFNNSSYTQNDNVSVSPAFANAVRAGYADFSTQSGCAVPNFANDANFNTRPDTRFVACVAPTSNFTYNWTASDGSVIPSIMSPQVVVNNATTYSVVVSDGDCQGNNSILIVVDSSAFIRASNDTVKCSADPVQLTSQVLYPSQQVQLPTYDVTATTVTPITPSGATTPGPAGDDIVGGPYTIPFSFNFFGTPYTSFSISTNGFITFTGGQGSGCCVGQLLPNATAPNNLVAMCWEDLYPGSGGNIDWFVTGTAPNRVVVIRWNNVAYFGGGGNVTGQIQLFETTNCVRVQVNSQNNPGQTNTLGIENAAGNLGYSPAGFNATGWTVTAGSPVGYSFCPQLSGASVTNIQWTPATGLSSTTVANPLATPATSTTYVVQYTFSTGCIGRDTVVVNVSTPVYTLAYNPTDSICLGDTTQLVFNGQAQNFNWSPATGLSSTTAQSPLAYPTQSTQYVFTANDSVGCQIRDTFTVVIRTHPVISLGNDTSVCPGSLATFSPDGGPYTSYNWNTNATTSSITVSSPGTYQVTVNDGYCDYVSQDVVLSNFTLSPIIADGDTNVCVGSCALLLGTPGLTNYLWNTGETTADITVCTAGIYFYTAADANNCQLISDTATLGIVQPPVITLTTTDDSVCIGQTSATLDAGSLPGITYTWTPGNTVSPTLSVSTPGTYVVTADDGGCFRVDSISIDGTVPPLITLGDDQATCACDTVITLSPGPGFSQYNWSTLETGTSIEVSETGNYTVVVTDFNGCTATDNVDLTFRCLEVTINVEPPTATVFPGQNATLFVPAENISYPGTFSYSWTPSTYLDDTTQSQVTAQAMQETTTYFVQLTDLVNGCVAFDSATVAVVPPGVFIFPDAFSPNGDGNNDVFFPNILGNQGATVTVFRIYNRWGQIVWDSPAPWDGTYNGAQQPLETYYFYAEIQAANPNNPAQIITYVQSGPFTLVY